MADLKPCPHCHRHIAIVEAACPFCSEPVDLAPSTPLRLGRMSRAAVFVAGAALATTAACGGKKAKPTQQQQTAPADAGVVKEPEPRPPNMPYGAPPVRRRFV